MKAKVLPNTPFMYYVQQVTEVKDEDTLYPDKMYKVMLMDTEIGRLVKSGFPGASSYQIEGETQPVFNTQYVAAQYLCYMSLAELFIQNCGAKDVKILI